MSELQPNVKRAAPVGIPVNGNGELDIVSPSAYRRQRTEANALYKQIGALQQQIRLLRNRQEKLSTELNAIKGRMPRVDEPNVIGDQPTVRKICKAVSETYGVPVIDLIAHRRTVNVAMPRHIACYLARVMTANTFPDIGSKMGGRDHSTIMSAYRKIAQKIEADPEFAAEIAALERKIKGRK